jgi:hypothetical protein
MIKINACIEPESKSTLFCYGFPIRCIESFPWRQKKLFSSARSRDFGMHQS